MLIVLHFKLDFGRTILRVFLPAEAAPSGEARGHVSAKGED